MDNLNQSLPNLFILGAPKAGTTTVYDTLKQYPEVYFPVQKEPSYFCDNEYFANGLDWYQETFYTGAQRFPVRGDASPRYLFWSKRVAPRIADVFTDSQPKFIVLFREPAKLVYSFYWQNVREGREPLSFPDALLTEDQRMVKHQEFLNHRGRIMYAYSKIAAYASQLQSFLDTFPREQFLFLLTDDLKDFDQMIENLENFLGLQKKSWDNGVRSNTASLPRNRRLHQWLRQPSKFKDLFKKFIPYSLRHKLKISALNLNLKQFQPPPLDPELAKQLNQHYLPEIKQLEKIIGRDLSSWYVDHE